MNIEKPSSTMQRQNQMNDLREKLNASKGVESRAELKPKLCKVCSRTSFLKCMECDTIYCSSKCQIRDWEEHQFTHSGMKKANESRNAFPLRFPPKPVNTKHESVQGRLQSCLQKNPIKVDIDAQLRMLDEKMGSKASQPPRGAPSSMDVDEISSGIGSVLKINSHPLSIEESVVDLTIRKMKSIRKFKRHIMLSEAGKDSDGYSYVLVTEVEEKLDGSLVYWVVPYEVKESYIAYKASLQETYSKDSAPTVPSIQELQKFKSHIVIAKIEGGWCRAQILSILEPDTVALVDIDSGKKAINVNTSSDQIKVALESEMIAPAFAMKVELNEGCEGIEAGDIIKLRITYYDGFGVSQAEVKLDEVNVGGDESESQKDKMDFENEVLANEEMKNEQKPSRHFCNEIQVKDFHIGPNIKVMFCDGSNLENGYIHVCEALKENWTFYEKLAVEIADHVKKNPQARNYKPEQRELVLAKYHDGYFYRGVCINSSEIDVKVFLLEYGSTHVVGTDGVMPLPSKFIYCCCSHTVQFTLASGRPISDIDGDETRERLMATNTFDAEVKLIPGPTPKYTLTLDDSLVIFKK